MAPDAAAFMTTPDAAALATALATYARDHGQAAADALVLSSATDDDLARVSAPLGDLRNSKGRRVGLGDQQRADIMHALARILDGNKQEPYTAIPYWDGIPQDADDAILAK